MESLRSIGIAALGATTLSAGMGPDYAQSAGNNAEIAVLKADQRRQRWRRRRKIRRRGDADPSGVLTPGTCGTTGRRHDSVGAPQSGRSVGRASLPCANRRNDRINERIWPQKG
jgi:hypothetical protein